MNSARWSENVRLIMKEQGISQAELARRTDILPQNINKYVTGKRAPSTQNVIRIAQALKVNVGSLFGGETHPAINKETLYDVFLKAFQQSKEQQVFSTLASDQVRELLNIVREFGGWRPVMAFLKEEIEMRRVGEKEYLRMQREINDEILESSRGGKKKCL